MKKLAISLAATAAAVAIAPSASAQATCTQTYDVGTVGSTTLSSGNVFTITAPGARTLCYTFQLTQAMTLSSAGFTVAAGSPFAFNITPGSLNLYSSATASNYATYSPITSSVSATYDSFGPMPLATNYYMIQVMGTSSASTSNTADVGSSFRFSPVASAVPEPAAWALMILGFGVVGYAMRRRPSIRFAQA